MSRKTFDPISFVRARKAEQMAIVSMDDIALLLADIEDLQGRCTTLEGQVLALLTHIHSYTDIDNVGTTLNKTTTAPQ